MITRKGYRKYRTIIQEKEVNQILDNGELQENYITWVDEVENTIKQVVKMKIKDPRQDMHKIQQKRKKLKMKLKTPKNKLEKHILLERVKILKEHITDKIKENRATRITKAA